MKILKRIILILAILIAIPLIVALFVKKDYDIEREVDINVPKDQVFNYIKYLKNQEEYSKWATMDPDMKRSFSGIDGTVGFVSAWESDDKNLGKGEQEIVKIAEGERIDYELRFFEPFETTDLAYMQTIGISENETRVIWGISGRMNYPMNLMLLIMNFDKMLGDDLEFGLKILKSILEEQYNFSDEDYE
jgi:uncharacterized protein YndB with AHSA1/START domain